MATASKGIRNSEIERLRQQGQTYAAIAKRYGLSTERVRQIIARAERNRRKIAVRLAAPASEDGRR